MTVNYVERVMRLVALSGSSEEKESTNAAREACRLMREHKLTVSGDVVDGSAEDWMKRAVEDTFGSAEAFHKIYKEEKERLEKEMRAGRQRRESSHAPNEEGWFDPRTTPVSKRGFIDDSPEECGTGNKMGDRCKLKIGHAGPHCGAGSRHW